MRALLPSPLLSDDQHKACALPGVEMVARVPGLILWDCAKGPDWSEGDSGRYTVEAVDSADWRQDGALGEFDTIGAALAAHPALAFAFLDAWEADDLKAPRPCPDLLGWVADCRADLPSHMAEVQTFADHLAALDAGA